MKIVALGVNSETNKCCIIKSNANFEMLKQDFDLYNVKFDSTNWCGRDDIERTLDLNELVLTDNKFKMEKTIRGTDSDWGHSYPWKFTFDTVVEVSEK